MASQPSTITWDDFRFTSEKTTPNRSRSSSRSPSETSPSALEAAIAQVQSDDAVATLSVATTDFASHDAEPNWPSGWRPYAALFGGFLLMFNSWGIVNAYGTYASYYMQHLLPNKDILLLNLVGSTQSAVVLALSAVVGRFLDAGHSRALIATGTVLVSLGNFLVSVSAGAGTYGSGNYGLIWLTQGLISGLGMAFFFVSSSQVVATWFKKKKGFAIGVVASGASIAGLVYPMMLKFLITEAGFNNAVRYVGAVIAATSLLAVFIARPNPAHQIRKPEKWARLTVFVDTHAVRNTSYVWLCAAICFLFFGFYTIFFNLEEWAASTGLGFRDRIPGGVDVEPNSAIADDAVRTFYLLALMNGASTLGRLGSSYLCDKFGALNVHATVTYVAALLVLCLWTTAKTVPAAIAFVVLFGIFSGAVIGLPPASVAFILGPDPLAQAKLGQWTGMMYSSAAIFALTGPVIAGHLISRYGDNFLTVQLWSGTCMMISAFCMSVAIFYRHKTSAREWAAASGRRLSSSVGTSVQRLKSNSVSRVSLGAEKDKEAA